MTATQRSRWNRGQLEKIRRFIRKRLDILTYTSREDKEEIESRVMDDMQENIASLSDCDIEHGYVSLEGAADSLVIGVLQEQDLRREMRVASLRS